MSLFQKNKEEDKEENLTMEELGTVMTILIEKKNKNEKFSVFDLDMFHQECEQGTIKLNPSTEGAIAYKLSFECQRCQMHTCIANQDNVENVEKTLIAMTQVALNDKTFNTKDTHKNTKIVFLQKK
jgi:hypothetical protein